MKECIKNMKILLLGVGVMAIMGNNAHAQINMPEREFVQTIVWIVEAATFFATVAIVLIVWRVSKRDRNIKNTNRTDDKNE